MTSYAMTPTTRHGKISPSATSLITTFNSSNADETNLEVHIEGLTPKLVDACHSVIPALREAGFHGKINSRITGTADPICGQMEMMNSHTENIRAQTEFLKAKADFEKAQNGSTFSLLPTSTPTQNQIMNVPAQTASQTAELAEAQARNAQLVKDMDEMKAMMQAFMKAQTPQAQTPQTPQAQPTVQTQPQQVMMMQAQTQPTVQIVQPLQTQPTVQTTETLSQYQGALTTDTQALTNHVMNVITGNIPAPPPPPPAGYIPQKKVISEGEVNKLAGALGKMNLNPAAAATVVKPQAEGHAELFEAIRKRGQKNDGVTPVESVEDKVNRQKAERAANSETPESALKKRIAEVARANGH